MRKITRTFLHFWGRFFKKSAEVTVDVVQQSAELTTNAVQSQVKKTVVAVKTIHDEHLRPEEKKFSFRWFLGYLINFVFWFTGYAINFVLFYFAEKYLNIWLEPNAFGALLVTILAYEVGEAAHYAWLWITKKHRGTLLEYLQNALFGAILFSFGFVLLNGIYPAEGLLHTKLYTGTSYVVARNLQAWLAVRREKAKKGTSE